MQDLCQYFIFIYILTSLYRIQANLCLEKSTIKSCIYYLGPMIYYYSTFIYTYHFGLFNNMYNTILRYSGGFQGSDRAIAPPPLGFGSYYFLYNCVYKIFPNKIGKLRRQIHSFFFNSSPPQITTRSATVMIYISLFSVRTTMIKLQLYRIRRSTL